MSNCRDFCCFICSTRKPGTLLDIEETVGIKDRVNLFKEISTSRTGKNVINSINLDDKVCKECYALITQIHELKKIVKEVERQIKELVEYCYNRRREEKKGKDNDDGQENEVMVVSQPQENIIDLAKIMVKEEVESDPESVQFEFEGISPHNSAADVDDLDNDVGEDFMEEKSKKRNVKDGSKDGSSSDSDKRGKLTKTMIKRSVKKVSRKISSCSSEDESEDGSSSDSDFKPKRRKLTKTVMKKRMTKVSKKTSSCGSENESDSSWNDSGSSTSRGSSQSKADWSRDKSKSKSGAKLPRRNKRKSRDIKQEYLSKEFVESDSCESSRGDDPLIGSVEMVGENFNDIKKEVQQQQSSKDSDSDSSSCSTCSSSSSSSNSTSRSTSNSEVKQKTDPKTAKSTAQKKYISSCSVCKKSFPYRLRRQLIIHEINKCKVFYQPEEIEKFGILKCSFPNCARLFPIKSKLERHIRRCHDVVKAFLCSKCGATFAEKYNLDAHSRIPRDCTISRSEASSQVLPKFECTRPGCCAAFISEKLLTTHVQRVHDRTLLSDPSTTTICEICGKTLQIKQVKTHVKRIHERVKNHPCPNPECGKAFFSLSEVRIHMGRIHNNNGKSVQCRFCSKVFLNSGDLRKHSARIHSGVERTFICDHCDLKFYSNSELKRHNRRRHEGNVSKKGRKKTAANKSTLSEFELQFDQESYGDAWD